MKLIRLYRDAGASSGGGYVPPSLADLDNPEFKPDPPAGDPPSPPPPAEPVEGLDADGNLLEGYEQLEDGTIQKIEPGQENPNDDDDNPGDDVDPTEFWKNVENLTGKPVEVDYGDVDPISPEGVAMREAVVRENAAQEFDVYLREAYPRAYAYFLHTQSGGSDDEFFGEPTQGLIDRKTFESDPDVQARWITQDLLNKGVPEEVAKATVDSYIKNNQLKERAIQLYALQEEQDRTRLKQMEESTQRQQAAYAAQVQNLNAQITNTIKKDMGVIVPEAKQAEFQKYVVDQIQHDGQKFYFVQEIGDKLNTALDALYLQFMNGDLKNLVEKRAQTKAVQRLGQRIKGDANQRNGGAGDGGSKKYVTLGEI